VIHPFASAYGLHPQHGVGIVTTAGSVSTMDDVEMDEATCVLEPDLDVEMVDDFLPPIPAAIGDVRPT
jgi:hypothetical protein